MTEKKLSLYQRMRLIKNISSQAIKEIKNAKSISELLDKHAQKGTCPICGMKDVLIIKNVNRCVKCALTGKKWERKFRKHATVGKCVDCGSEGLVSKIEGLCWNCYIKKLHEGL